MLRRILRSHCRWASHPVKAAANTKPTMYPPVGPAITPKPDDRSLNTGSPTMPSTA